MKTLDRYIFREIFFPSVIALAALTFVAFLAFSREIGWLLELIVRQSATISDTWTISLAILPNVLTFTIPMAVLVGILTGFGRISSDSEAIAFRASGLYMIRLLFPVMLLGVIGCGASLAINASVAPGTASRLRELRYEIAARQVSLEVKPRVFNESLTNLVLYVENTAPEGFRWDGIMLPDMTQADQPRVTFARSGNLFKDDENHAFVLTLTNGSTHFVAPLSPDRYSFDTFETTRISVPIPETPAKPDMPTLQETTTRIIWRNMQAKTATGESRSSFTGDSRFPSRVWSLPLSVCR